MRLDPISILRYEKITASSEGKDNFLIVEATRHSIPVSSNVALCIRSEYGSYHHLSYNRSQLLDLIYVLREIEQDWR